MLEQWLSVTHRNQQAEQEKIAFQEDLKKLPVEDLKKLAFGETSFEKLAGSGPTWLAKFRDTPLFDQALELEQLKIQLDAERIQQDQEHLQIQELSRRGDHIRLQKRLLELHLTQLQAQGQAPPSPPADSGPRGCVKRVGERSLGSEWLQRFVGTPLFEQAAQLEQAELSHEAAYLHARITSENDRPWLKQSLLDVQKRALWLELMRLRNAAPPADPSAEPELSPEEREQYAARFHETLKQDLGQGGADAKVAASEERQRYVRAFHAGLKQRLGQNGQKKEATWPAWATRENVQQAAQMLSNLPEEELLRIIGEDAKKHLVRKGVQRARTHVLDPSMRSYVAAAGKEPGAVSRFRQLLTGSRAKELDTLARRTSHLGALGETELAERLMGGLSPVAQTAASEAASAFTSSMDDALKQEIAAERLRTGLTRGLTGAALGGAALHAATRTGDMENPDNFLPKVAAIPISLVGGLRGGASTLSSRLGRINAATGGGLGRGALVGTAAGAISGMRRDEHGETNVLRNALLGGAMGAGAGAVGGNTMRAMGRGAGFSEALGQGARATWGQVKGLGGVAQRGFKRGAVVQGVKDSASSALDTAKRYVAPLGTVAGIGAAAGTVAKYAPQVEKGINYAGQVIANPAQALQQGRAAVSAAANKVRDMGVTGVASAVQQGARVVDGALQQGGPIDAFTQLMNNAKTRAAQAGAI